MKNAQLTLTRQEVDPETETIIDTAQIKWLNRSHSLDTIVGAVARMTGSQECRNGSGATVAVTFGPEDLAVAKLAVDLTVR